jgi:hypothetical protein
MDLKSRGFLIQMKKIAGKMIVCNLHGFLQFFIILQSTKWEQSKNVSQPSAPKTEEISPE